MSLHNKYSVIAFSNKRSWIQIIFALIWSWKVAFHRSRSEVCVWIVCLLSKWSYDMITVGEALRRVWIGLQGRMEEFFVYVRNKLKEKQYVEVKPNGTPAVLVCSDWQHFKSGLIILRSILDQCWLSLSGLVSSYENVFMCRFSVMCPKLWTYEDL